jgi:hypothetical protein
MAILFALLNGGEQQPWHHMNRLSPSSSSSIRTWYQLNGETLAGKSAHQKVKRINTLKSI